MITRKSIALAAMLLTLTLTAPLMAQRRNGNDAQQKGPDYNPKAGSADEFAAFQGIQNEQDPTNKINLADAFLTKYPSSQLAGYVQRFRMESFSRLRKYKEAAAAGEAGLALETKYLSDLIAKADQQAADAKDKSKKDKKDKDKEPLINKNSAEFKAIADNTEKAMMYYYQNLMTAYQNLNDAEKTVEWGRKALSEDPEDVTALLTVSSVMAARPKDDKNPNGFDQKEAEDLGKKGLNRLNAVFSGPMGAQLRPEDKAEMLASAHETIGRIYLNNKKYPEAQREFGQAIVSKKDDSQAYFFMGMAMAQDKGKVEDAMENFAKAVYLKGPISTQADSVLKDLFKQTKKPLEGYDDFVKAAGAKIGK